MISAILGFSGFASGAGDDGANPDSGDPPEHPFARPDKTTIKPQATQYELV
jgi:hypothetical protein